MKGTIMVKQRLRALAVAFIATLLSTATLFAQQIETHRISFPSSATGTTVSGSIRGSEIIDFVLNARAGQRMTVQMSTDNPSAYFNVNRSGRASAIHIGSTDGLAYNGILPESGDWVVRVYLIRAAARRGEVANYSVTFSIGTNSTPQPIPDFADGDAGGPDYWRVVTERLNIRTGPSTSFAVAFQARFGDVFRNLGCKGIGVARWCQLETPDARRTGWAVGRFLRESASPPVATQLPTIPPTVGGPDPDRGGPDWWYVAGVPLNDTLNIRSGPSTSNRIVARETNGTLMRNLGCRQTGNTRWCRVEPENGGYTGWASQRYLREGAAPPSAGGTLIPSGSAVTPDLFTRSSGEIEARWSNGCTVLYSPVRRRINAGSSCSNSQLRVSDATVRLFK